MIIAITARGNNLESDIDSRFGRAVNFIVYNTEDKTFKVVDNQQNLQSAQGAGIQAGEKVASLGVEAVLTGHCGPKAFRVLSAANIKIYVGIQGKIKDAIEKYLSDDLKSINTPDVEGHWV